MEVSVLYKTIDLVLKFLGRPITSKIISIWKYEKEVKKLVDTIECIGDVLSDVHGQRFQDSSLINGYRRLREAFLDAEDFLDRIETIQKKKDAKARKTKQAEEGIVNGKGKRSLAYVRIKIKPFKIKACRFFSSSNQAKYALEVNNAIRKIRKNLDAIWEDLQKLCLKEPNISSDATHMTARASGPYVDATEIIGRDEDKGEIVSLLRSSIDQKRIPVISIVGIGGMGKTTAAQLVHDDKSLQECCKFDMKLWVSDSKRFDFKSLLKHMLKSACPNATSLDDLEEDHLSERFAKEIGGKRFLLVLDDVDNEDPWTWEKIEKLLNCGSKESRILITTRSRKVAEVVGSSGRLIYELEGLSEKDSLQLFEKYAFRGRKDESLVEIGNLIVQKCRGVPLAIKVVGSLLCGKEKHKWEFVRDNSIADITDEGNQLMPILKISYDDLDSMMKQCFSLCALFPKNCDISKEILSNIWMDNVHFKTNKGETLEDVCEKSLTILYNRCFLEAIPWKRKRFIDVMKSKPDKEWGDIEYFKMHDLMHDLAKEVARTEVLVMDSDELVLEKDVRHIFLTYEASRFQPKGKRIRTLLQVDRLWDPRQIVFDDDKIVSNCPVLRLLDVRWGMIENLTNSIGKLIHLRCLFLSYNPLKTLPHSITELINLRHLELSYCEALTQLPSGIGSLTYLEVFDLSYCRKLEDLPSGIKNLVNLRHLSLRHCESLCHLPSGMGALTYLQTLDISSCMKLRELPRGIEKLTKLRHLYSEHCYDLSRIPYGMAALMPVCTPGRFIVGDPKSEHTAQLEELGPLSDLPARLLIHLPDNITLTPSQNGDAFLLSKKSLRILKIYYYQGEVSNNHMEILGKLQPPSTLEELKLVAYQGMFFPSWFAEDGPANVFPNLVSLDIWDCRNCRYLPRLSRLPCLRSLRLSHLSSLEYIEQKEEYVSHAPFCVPKLERLELVMLPELKDWCRGLASFPCLSFLHIYACSNLAVSSLLSFPKPLEKDLSWKTQETASSSPCLPLFVQVCIDSTFNLSLEEDSLRLKISNYKPTKNIPSHYIVETFKGMFHHLTHLLINNCSLLKTLPHQHLTALLELKIIDCCDFTGEEEEIQSSSRIPWSGLKSLQHLTLCDLPKMVRLPEEIQFVTSLQELRIEDCHNLVIPEWLHNTFEYKTREFLWLKKEIHGCFSSTAT